MRESINISFVALFNYTDISIQWQYLIIQIYMNTVTVFNYKDIDNGFNIKNQRFKFVKNIDR